VAHPHAALIMQFALDAQELDNPEELWEVNYFPEIDFPEIEQGWVPINKGACPAFNPKNQYRRKETKIKKWLWLIKRSGGTISITENFYSDPIDIEVMLPHGSTIIGPALWSEIEI
jgi:hypothetical protein